MESQQKRRSPSPQSTRKESPTRKQSPTRKPSPTRPISPSRKQTSGGISPTRKRSPSPTTRTKTTSTGEGRRGVTDEVKVNIRQNFSDEAENELNKLIHLFMVNGYQCIAMAAYFDRDEVGLFGVAHFCKWTSVEIYHCVRLLMDYMVLRGGCVRLEKIEKPSKTEWKTPIEAMEEILQMKEIVYDKVVSLHKSALTETDGHLVDFLESGILRPLVACNRQLVVLVSNSKRAGPALGEYQFNKHLESFLQNVMRDPTLSHLVHGGISYLNMYKPPTTPMPIDFGSVLNQFVTATPELANMDLHHLIHLVGNFNIGDIIRPFIKTPY